MKIGRQWRIVFAALFVGGMIAFFGFGLVLEWIGQYTLTVIISNTDQPPEWVYCHAMPDRAMAQRYLDAMVAGKGRIRYQSGSDCAMSDPYDGHPIEVANWTSGQRSFIFGELDHGQFGKYLTILAGMPDGRRIGTVVAIPDFHTTKAISVSLP